MQKKHAPIFCGFKHDMTLVHLADLPQQNHGFCEVFRDSFFWRATLFRHKSVAALRHPLELSPRAFAHQGNSRKVSPQEERNLSTFFFLGPFLIARKRFEEMSMSVFFFVLFVWFWLILKFYPTFEEGEFANVDETDEIQRMSHRAFQSLKLRNSRLPYLRGHESLPGISRRFPNWVRHSVTGEQAKLRRSWLRPSIRLVRLRKMKECIAWKWTIQIKILYEASVTQVYETLVRRYGGKYWVYPSRMTVTTKDDMTFFRLGNI